MTSVKDFDMMLNTFGSMNIKDSFYDVISNFLVKSLESYNNDEKVKVFLKQEDKKELIDKFLNTKHFNEEFEKDVSPTEIIYNSTLHIIANCFLEEFNNFITKNVIIKKDNTIKINLSTLQKKYLYYTLFYRSYFILKKPEDLKKCSNEPLNCRNVNCGHYHNEEYLVEMTKDITNQNIVELKEKLNTKICLFYMKCNKNNCAFLHIDKNKLDNLNYLENELLKLFSNNKNYVEYIKSIDKVIVMAPIKFEPYDKELYVNSLYLQLFMMLYNDKFLNEPKSFCKYVKCTNKTCTFLHKDEQLMNMFLEFKLEDIVSKYYKMKKYVCLTKNCNCDLIHYLNRYRRCARVG